MRDLLGDSKLLHEVSPAEAKKYYDWLQNHEKLKEINAKRRTGITRQIFNEALEAELISRNPFKQRSIKVAVGAGKKTSIAKETILKTIEYCPSIEWKLLFAFARFVGCRIPSENRELAWSGKNWSERTIHLKSPKTAVQGKPERLFPIGAFDELAPLLDQAFL